MKKLQSRDLKELIVCSRWPHYWKLWHEMTRGSPRHLPSYLWLSRSPPRIPRLLAGECRETTKKKHCGDFIYIINIEF